MGEIKDDSRNFILLVGPGHEAWSDEEARGWRERLKPRGGGYWFLGGEEEGLSIASMQAVFNEAAQTRKPTTIFVMAHGEQAENKRYIQDGSSLLLLIGQDALITSRAFFEVIGNAFQNQPVEIVLATCRAGAAIADMDMFLARGSKVAAFSGSRMDLAYVHSRWFFNAMPEENSARTADRLIDAFIYAPSGWPAGSDPVVGTVGRGVEIPSLALQKLIARQPRTRDILPIKNYIERLSSFRWFFPQTMRALCAAKTIADIDKNDKSGALLAARAVDRTQYSLATYERYVRRAAMKAKDTNSTPAPR